MKVGYFSCYFLGKRKSQRKFTKEGKRYSRQYQMIRSVSSAALHCYNVRHATSMRNYRSGYSKMKECLRKSASMKGTENSADNCC